MARNGDGQGSGREPDGTARHERARASGRRGTRKRAPGPERKKTARADAPLSALLRVPPGRPVDLSSYDPRATPGGPPDKAAALAETALAGRRLSDLQERLYAAGTAGDRRRLLVVLQGMDTSGKGGTVKHVAGFLNPAGCRITAFGTPTAEELGHPFLWRVMRALPGPGEIGIFDRSHYEDVLIARVRRLVPRERIDRRYDQINRFEESLAEDGVTLVKIFLHIGPEEQRERLLRRLDDPRKRWKFDPADIGERARWPAYRKACERVLTRCSTAAAPWFVVPADRKWYRNWAVCRLLVEHLEALDPRFPEAGYDVAKCREFLLAGA
ncbi:PPK2 family polyphosphate kinase [Streptomyces genisteinicus]|uniref:Polyphosphate kinase 2 family protein n=1 Tax=Streptomyces genisteinicus TaxID=2768068 RepID=A0A7H0HZT2_9ACTN|nr:polyphosphate kinase 2 family protein [Streptomyces genisteinicus]